VVIIALFLRYNAIDSPDLVFNLVGIQNAITYFLGYVKMTFLPFPQRFYIDEPIEGVLSIWEMIISIIAIVGFIVLIWKKQNGRRFIILSLAWYLLILAPAIAVSFHAVRPTFAARLLYMGIFPVSMIILWLLNNANTKWRHIYERSLMALIVVYMFLSIWTTFSWKSQCSLVDLMVVSTPENVALQIDLGDCYIEKGMLNEAVLSYEKAVALIADDNIKIIAHERLGELYGKNNLFKKAQLEFEAVLKLDPENSSALNGLGNLAWLSKDLISAKEYYERALASDPENTMAARNLNSVNQLLSAN